MRGRRGSLTLLLLATLALASPAWGKLAVEVSAPAPGDTLTASFRLSGVIDEGDMSALGEGVPATLTLVIDLWRKKSSWWDKVEASRTRIATFQKNLLTETYRVRMDDGTEATLPDRGALADYLEQERELVLGPGHLFPRGKSYYVTVKAVIRPITLEDLERVDAWLSGEVTEGRGGGGVMGFPKAMLGLVVDLSGLGDRSAVGRSALFVPNPHQE